jgi:hypothetical protein
MKVFMLSLVVLSIFKVSQTMSRSIIFWAIRDCFVNRSVKMAETIPMMRE